MNKPFIKNSFLAFLIFWGTTLSVYAISGSERYKAAHGHFGNKGMGITAWLFIAGASLFVLFIVWRMFKKKT